MFAKTLNFDAFLYNFNDVTIVYAKILLNYSK